ncbi:Na/Pi cotransporter family protein [Romboutsia sp.]|uniref:Na/Pi cotransporter family protein n=1 Tax=Romboutsia sp. TaxID=1965302 RepID=UPI003F3C32D5
MKIIIGLMGGLGLFIFGMDLMRRGLQRCAGENIKKIVDLITKNILFSILVGLIVTVIIQSSSATTVMVVGLVNAGILGLPQALGIIMGANIGTTITSQLVSFNLHGIESLALIVGILLYLFPPSAKYKYFSEVLLGIGILFVGMNIMKTSVEPLMYLTAFKNTLLYFIAHPTLGILAGFLVTGVIQSSSASIGMLMAICSNGLLPLTSALPIVYGGNIGTCVTSLFSSVGANKNSRRAAIMHLIFNVIGTIIFVLFLSRPLESLVIKMSPGDISRQIANSHTLFNLINTILLLPFTNYIVKLTNIIIPYDHTENSLVNTTMYLDERILQTPSLALSNTMKEVGRMGDRTLLALDCSLQAILTSDLDKVKKALYHEEKVNKIQKDILNYLLSLSKTNLSEDESYRTTSIFSTVNDIEKICNYAEDIANMTNTAIIAKFDLSEIDRDELISLYNKIITNFNNAIISLQNKDTTLANKVIEAKKEIYYLEKTSRKAHINKLNEGNCNIEIGIMYLNLISNLEKISIHSANIAEQVLMLRYC